ncbi:MAG: Light-independent protochlorophyllide reductase subunit B [Paraeggerthella hongkongensis]
MLVALCESVRGDVCSRAGAQEGEHMDGLHYFDVLPAFAPDYSGAVSVLYDLQGTIVVNGASGCLANCAGYDEPRYFEKTSLVLSSGLRDVRAIFGDEEFLEETLPLIEGLQGSRYLALLASPAAAIIGTDHKAVAAALEDRLSLPCFAFETTGMTAYDRGASMVMMELCRRYAKPAPRSVGPSANILGAIPLDLWGPDQLAVLREDVEREGYRVICTLGMDYSLEDVERLAEAHVNVVVSVAALASARWLEQTFGTPWTCALPVGPCRAGWMAPDGFQASSDSWKAQFSAKPLGGVGNPCEPACGVKVLIVGQQVWANAFRAGLMREVSGADCTVASFFGMDDELMLEGDRSFSSEGEFCEHVVDRGYDVVIGDPLFQEAIPCEVAYVGVPHVAVSSRLYWTNPAPAVGPDALSAALATIEHTMVRKKASR